MTFNPTRDGMLIPTKNDVTDLIDPGSKGHFEFIRRAHERSVSAGLEQERKADLSLLTTGQELKLLVEKNYSLRRSALPFMETLHEQVMSTHSMVILTDASGTIIEALGDDEFLEKAEKVALQPGAHWSEETKGTNAIGTALVEELPTVVHAHDHFLNVNHFLTCSAAPIFDPNGLPIGVLDVTGDYRSYHRHTMGLVKMSAQMIENHLFNASFKEAIIVQFHNRGEFLGSAVEGAAAFGADGKFLAANRVAMIQFGMSIGALKMHTFSSLFGMPLSSLIDHYRACNPENLTLCLSNGNQVIARASLGSIGRSKLFNAASLVKNGGEKDMGATAANQQPSSIAAPEAKQPCINQRNRHLSSLKYLNTGDPQIGKVIDKVGKVIDKDIPILILGETGTGKEILAQAIHNDSPRQNKPFVAVNCASIPETLIESELFGYEDGAFTGARKKGSQGKIIQANGGTLFLDEIGDMPLPLQARLLRVLQERVVTPLGSQKSYPVNLMVICATHRNLRDQITSGLFREDLYYRLHGLAVKLPALRDRTDIKRIIGRILENESENEDLAIHTDVLRAFEAYDWPGNIRQLTNILRTASVMACNKAQIEWDDLPDDFLDEFGRQQSAQPKPADNLVSVVFDRDAPLKLAEDAPQSGELMAEPPNLPGIGRTGGARKTPAFSIKTNISSRRPNVPHADPKATEGTAVGARAKFQVHRHGATQGTRENANTHPLSRFREERFAKQVNRLDQASSRRPEQASQPRWPAVASTPAQAAAPMRTPQDMKAQGYAGSRSAVTPPSHPMNLEDMETLAIQEALETCRGNVSAAARMLGISRNTIYRRLNAKN